MSEKLYFVFEENYGRPLGIFPQSANIGVECNGADWTAEPFEPFGWYRRFGNEHRAVPRPRYVLRAYENGCWDLEWDKSLGDGEMVTIASGMARSNRRCPEAIDAAKLYVTAAYLAYREFRVNFGLESE